MSHYWALTIRNIARPLFLSCAVALLSLPFHLQADDETEKPVLDAKAMSTHKQSTAIKPVLNGKPIQLNTFCLDQSGNILACVGGDSVSFEAKEDGTYKAVKTESPKALQSYSPTGELLWQVELSFKPTAINQSADGHIFVAGGGKVARLDNAGKILSIIDAPNLGDLDSLRERVAEAAAKQKAELLGSFTEQLDRVNKRIAKIEEKAEADRSEREVKQLAAFEKQRTMYAEQLSQMEAMYAGMFDVDSTLDQKLTITAIAVNSQDVFVCCSAMEGYGYEVWRLDHQLESPKKVVDTLGGCCGQCDIQCTEEHLVIADNTKFQVTLLDRDGQSVSSFGKRDGEAVDGFGSCCNPMNVRCCANGDILTAESSIGWIKRFNAAGELVSVIGKAGIGGGCKHVAIGFDAERDRYYMMNVDKSLICVLVPKSEAPEFTEEELAAKAAHEGLGQKLIGTWTLAAGEVNKDAKPSTDEKAGTGEGEKVVAALRIVTSSDDDKQDGKQGDKNEEGDLGSAEETEMIQSVQVAMPKALTFEANGKLSMKEFAMFGEAPMKWEAVRQEGNRLTVNQLMDGVATYEIAIEFKEDGTASMVMQYDGNPVMPGQIYRKKE